MEVVLFISSLLSLIPTVQETPFRSLDIRFSVGVGEGLSGECLNFKVERFPSFQLP